MDSSPEEFKLLEKAIIFLRKTEDFELKYFPLDLPISRIVLMTDASFTNSRGLKYQLSYVIALADDNYKANIFHYGSNLCKRVARSLMAAEVHGLVLGFYYAYIVRELVSKILGRNVSIESYGYRKTLFNLIAKYGSTSERRLQIDIFA